MKPAARLGAWLERLENLSPVEIVMGLERVVEVLERLDMARPDCVLHVGGTNGKGSSVAMLEAVYMTTDALVGSYTSPHVIRYNERIRVAGEPLPDDEVVAAFERVEAARGDTPLTYFEFGTLAAVAAFESAGVGIAVLEIGMGGRLDAVNAIEPDAGLITNVALDHSDWLGEDVESIAFEKAGIMRSAKPLVFGARDVPRAIEHRAADTGADLRLAGRDFDWRETGTDRWDWRGRDTQLLSLRTPSLEGAFQLGNAAAVLALVEAAGHSRLLEARRVNDALGGIRLPGRMQRLHDGNEWLFDVAHNPAAAAALAGVLEARRRDVGMTAIVGMLDDKDVEGMVAPLAAVVDRWIAVTAESPRAIDAHELARRIVEASRRDCVVADTIDQAITRARASAPEDGGILVTGSFYVVGPVLESLGL